jgi:hypothetical protein
MPNNHSAKFRWEIKQNMYASGTAIGPGSQIFIYGSISIFLQNHQRQNGFSI